MPLKRVRTAVLPVLAAAAWGVTIWVDLRPGGIDVDRDDLCPAMLAIVLTVWTLIDFYYRRLNRDRQDAHAGHDVSVLAEGVAAYIAQQDAGDGERSPAPRRGS